ncbi:hypothetical protein B0A78_03110 [Flavobacterium columnare NBRC 100251 = ATCC 23463]|uniref:Uncharacterized protein n=2 Tax=Flavobacterium columnare TaxID=996 RepID=G8X824_FLACA|nr:hypothetical protein [Flavobacterium columnare]AEW87138.1 hypothetical protein FCOL_11685 [Flavobacterium columnare ATCC 49512]PDS26011.1 hypothetical protein B0A78_03110 [Flavobacterium columnare NBRC 100251 = ATCC 23463]APT21821.1 hypothetical protein BU993_03725 [Flavobacterium columnare]MBF6651365.1 hypothetical protein [Flavobacterium columnare]MBF6658243.1 hypothetical protein [Flavobacterium columnare]
MKGSFWIGLIFYSALHFVHGKLLPSTYNGILCNSIEDAYRVLKCKGKHEATCQLVQVGLPVVAAYYSFLMNCSFTARYVDYKVHPEHSKLCQKYLNKIKEACL